MKLRLAIHKLLSRRRTLLAVHYGISKVTCVQADYSQGSWSIGKSFSTNIDSSQQFELPSSILERSESKRYEVLLILEPAHYETRLVHYPRNIGVKRLTKVLQYDIQEHSLDKQENILFYYGAPQDNETSLTIPFYSIKRSVHEFITRPFKDLGTSVHTIPDAVLVPCFWKQLFPGTSNGILAKTDDSCTIGYAITAEAVTESLVLEQNSPLTQLWSSKTEYRRPFAQALHIADRSVKGTNHKERKSPNNNACCISPWCIEMTQCAISKPTLATFDGPVRVTPQNPSVAILTAIAILLVHLVIFTAAISYRNVQMDVMETTQKDLQELYGTWEPLKKQWQLMQDMQIFESRLAALKTESIPLEPLLTNLTHHTPKNTWLREISLTGNRLTLRGEAPEALVYRNILASQVMFNHVEFVGSITKNPDKGNEQFSITLIVDSSSLANSHDAKKANP